MKKRLLFLPILIFMALSFFMLLSKSPVEIMSGWASDIGLLKVAEDRANPEFIDIGGIVARFTDSIPEHLRAFELVSVILISFGLLFLLMALPLEEPNITDYAIMMIIVFLNPIVLGVLLNFEGHALPFFFIALSVMLFRRKGVHPFFIGLAAGLTAYSGWGYVLFVLGFIPFLGDKKRLLWKAAGVLAGVGTALLPMLFWRLSPTKIDIYAAGHSHGLSIDGNMIYRQTGLAPHFGKFLFILLTFILAVFLLSLMIRKKDIRPFAVSGLIMLASDFFFGTGLWPFYMLCGFSFALIIREDRAGYYIPATALGLLLFILLLIPPKRDISAHLEMGRYIGRTGVTGIVAIRPGLLSIVTGQPIEYPPESDLSPKEALLNIAFEKQCQWAIVALPNSLVKDTFSTFETKTFNIPALGEYRLCLLPIDNIPDDIDPIANISHF